MVWCLWKEENAGLRGQGGSQDRGNLVGEETFSEQNILFMVILKVLCPTQNKFFDGFRHFPGKPDLGGPEHCNPSSRGGAGDKSRKAAQR